jgi:hypothetical protein
MRDLTKPFLYAFLALFLTSCGGKNETGSAPTPITGIGLQNSNILAPYDPSFESAVDNNGRRGQANNFFRINSRDRRFSGFEVSEISAHSGSKSLRIYEPHTKVLLYPITKDSQSRLESPLQVVSNAKYRLQVRVRLPRSSNRRRAMRVITTLRYYSAIGNSRSVFSEVITMESQGVDNNNWETFNLEFDTPADSQTLRLGFSFGRVEELLFDSVSLVRI